MEVVGFCIASLQNFSQVINVCTNRFIFKFSNIIFDLRFFPFKFSDYLQLICFRLLKGLQIERNESPFHVSIQLYGWVIMGDAITGLK